MNQELSRILLAVILISHRWWRLLIVSTIGLLSIILWFVKEHFLQRDLLLLSYITLLRGLRTRGVLFY